MDTEQQLCTFSVAGKHYAVQVETVQEVLANHPITDIPLAPAGVLGLMNIRGRIVPAIDLGRVLRLADQPVGEDSVNIIVNYGNDQVGLMVEKIGDIVTVDKSEMAPPPETLRGAVRQFMQGVYRVDGQLFLLLDVDALLNDELCNQAAWRPTQNVLQ